MIVNAQKFGSALGSKRGAIMPLFAICAIALIALIALVVDLGTLLNSIDQLQTKIDQAALGGISQYSGDLQSFTASSMSTPSDSTFSPCPECTVDNQLCRNTCAVKAAILRAGAVSNLQITLGERSRRVSKVLSDFGKVAQGSKNVLPGADGSVVPGKYHWFKLGGDDPPCGPPPCFEPITDPNNFDQTNAVRVTGSLAPTNPITSTFAKIIGLKEFAFQVRSVSTLLPRNDVFGIDLSPSVYRDNYLRWGQLCGSRCQPGNTYGNTCGVLKGSPGGPDDCSGCYAFTQGTVNKCKDASGVLCADNCQISADACATDPSCGGCSWGPQPLFNGCIEDGSRGEWIFMLNPDSYPPNVCDSSAGMLSSIACQTTAGCKVAGALAGDSIGTAYQVDLQDVWNRLKSFPSDWPPAVRVLPYKHTKSQFRCRDVYLSRGSRPVSPAPDARSFLYKSVFTLSESQNPSPYRGILGATNAGMVQIWKRAVSLDRFSLVGFDETLYRLRMTCDSEPESGRLLCPLVQPRSRTPGGTPYSPTGAFERFLDATNLSRINNFGGPIDQGLFPLPWSNTDIQRFVMEATNQIANNSTNPNYQIGKNSIFIFTDGQSNCPWERIAGTPDPQNPWSVWKLKYESPNQCKNNSRYVMESLAALGNPQFVAELIKRKISVSLALIGDKSGAHYLLKRSKSSPGICMDFVEAYNSKERFVASKFDVYQANPEAANQDFRSSDSNVKFYAPNELYQMLVQPTGGIFAPILPQLKNSSGGVIAFADEINALCNSATYQTPTGAASVGADGIYRSALIVKSGKTYQIADNEGRMLYDPLGRSVQDQLQNAVTQAIQSPYVLVPAR